MITFLHIALDPLRPIIIVSGSSLRSDNHVYSSPSVTSDDLRFIPNGNQIDDLLDPEGNIKRFNHSRTDPI